MTRGAGLTRKSVVEAALRLLDEVGVEGLTVRRLAAVLGVQSPALYWHFRNKQDLFDAMADEVIQAAGMGPPGDGEPWPDWLARRARAYRRSVLAHRDGARIVVQARSLSPAAIRRFDEELTAMVELGFTPALALRTITALSQYVHGFVLQEQASRREEAGDRRAELALVAGVLDRGAGATLLVALREGGSPVGEEAFEHGLRTLLAGTEAARRAVAERQESGS